MTRKMLAVCAAVVALAGCGEGEPAGTKTVTMTAAATASTSPTPTRGTATPTPKAPRKVGQSWKGPDVTLTVQKVIVNKKDQNGDPYSGALVKACVTKIPAGLDSLYFSWSPWVLVDADAGRYPDNGTSGGGLPTPVYPNGPEDGTFQAGECTRGWIFFDVPKGTKITGVRYESDGVPEPVIWAR